MLRDICLVDDFEFSPFEDFEMCYNPDGTYSLMIYVNEGTSLLDQLQKKEKFFQTQKMNIAADIFFGTSKDTESKACDFVYQHFDHLLDCVPVIRVNNTDYNLYSLIKDNPILLSKKIIYDKVFNANEYDLLKGFVDSLKEYADSVYIHIDGNYYDVNTRDGLATLKHVKDLAEHIKTFAGSPLEKIMLTYDIVRNREYKYEDVNDDFTQSRDLTKIIQGDKIVCIGYARLFYAVLFYLGIKNDIVYLSGVKSNHSRNCVFVDDPKYNVKGFYFFDSTWDSKKPENNNFLKSYRYFAKTKEELTYYDNKKQLTIDPIYSIYNIDEYLRFVKKLNEPLTENNMRYFRMFNSVYRSAYGEGLIKMSEIMKHSFSKKRQAELSEKFLDLIDYFENPIPPRTMIDLYQNVRKVEHYYKPELYTYNVEDTIATAKRSNWVFEGLNISAEEKLLSFIFGDGQCGKTSEDNLKEYLSECGLERNVQEVELARVLRCTYEKKRR